VDTATSGGGISIVSANRYDGVSTGATTGSGGSSYVLLPAAPQPEAVVLEQLQFPAQVAEFLQRATRLE